MIDFARDDQLPTVFIEQIINDRLDVLVGDVIAAADQHRMGNRQT
jgi:hypothetical protein